MNEEPTVTEQGEELDPRAEETTPANGEETAVSEPATDPTVPATEPPVSTPPAITDATIVAPPPAEVDAHAGESWNVEHQIWMPKEA